MLVSDPREEGVGSVEEEPRTARSSSCRKGITFEENAVRVLVMLAGLFRLRRRHLPVLSEEGLGVVRGDEVRAAIGTTPSPSSGRRGVRAARRQPVLESAVVLLALVASLGGASAAPADLGPGAARLAQRRPVTVVCLGDSITSGLNVPDPPVNGYPALFGRMVEERFPRDTVVVQDKGVPGNTTDDALARFKDDVAAAAPDLVTLQFGGNDKGVGDGLENLPRYQQNLRRLIGECDRIGAACIVVTPPMHEPVTDMPFPVAARRVAQELRVPVADIDTALKSREHDYRGFFPYFFHPQEHGQAIMAVELYRAFCELIGENLHLAVSVDDTVQTDGTLGGYATVPIRVTNTSAVARKVVLRGEAILPFHLDDLDVPAGGTQLALLPIALPHTLSGGRSWEWPLWVSASAGDEVAFGLARVALVPVLGCPQAEHFSARAPFANLSWPHILIGRDQWKGDRDLSADVYLSYDEQNVHLGVDVTDDIVVTKVAMPYGDGIELYLDLRDDDNRGKPFFGKQCATIFIGAAMPPNRPPVTTPVDDATPPELMALQPRCTSTARGYRLDLDLPRSALDRIAGRRVTRFGLDLALDDCDDGAMRKCQMIWLGRPDDFVNPRRYGELRLEPSVVPGTVRLTVF